MLLLLRFVTVFSKIDHAPLLRSAAVVQSSTRQFEMNTRPYADRSFKSINSDGSSGKRSERNSPEPDDQNDLSARFWHTWEKLEFYVWIAFGSYAWYYTVFKILDWHRFPVHLYPFELWMLVVVPIVLIIAMLYLLDYIFAKSKTD